jgi:hypothetical protein
VVVAFRSDPATCAAVGRCGLEGIVVSAPPARARLRLSPGGAFLAPAFTPSGAGSGTVTSRVARDGRVCTDARVVENVLGVARRGTALRLGPASSPDGLVTRCAGPLFEDVAAALPVRALPLATLRGRGALPLDLAAEASFTAGGLTGTVSSTVRGRLGGARTPSGESFGIDLRDDPRLRGVLYDVAVTGGALRLLAVAPPEPERCRPLGACGLRVTSELTARPGRGLLELAAAPGRRARGLPLREVLRLAARGGERRGIGGTGVLPTTALAVATRGGDAGADCRDTSRGPRPLLFVTNAPRGRVRFVLGDEPGGQGLRSRCPGPVLPVQIPLAVADVPATALARRRLTITLRSRLRTRADGYAIAGDGALTLTLVRRAGRVPAHPETQIIR